jgi:hypothetical protein
VLCASKGLVLCVGAKCGSISKQRFGAVLVPNKPSKGLVYLTTKSLVLWWVRCGYILHPSFGLVLGLVLRGKDKKQEVRSKDNKLKLGYTL